MAAIPTVKLNSGHHIPVLGLGTWKSKPGEVRTAVEAAIDVGYRHFDCAPLYENEPEVGSALRSKMMAGVVTREQLFITSKLWNTYHEPDTVEEGCRQTLKDLGLEYLDLFLMHFPVAFKQKNGCTSQRDSNNQIIMTDRDYVDTWLAMEKLVSLGLVKSIGVSNFNHTMIDRVLEKANIKPAVNQVECHPYLNQTALSAYCETKGIVLTAYSAFASPDRPWAKPEDPKLLEDPKITAVAKKYSKSTAQILLKYQVQMGHAVIPKSVSPSRIAENSKIFDFELSVEDMATIASLECGGRVVKMDFAKGHKYYPF